MESDVLFPDEKFTPFEKYNMVYMSSDHTYIVSFKDDFTPMKRGSRSGLHQVRLFGVDKGTSMIMGICIPIGTELTIGDHTRLNSMDELKNTDSGSTYFHDKTFGIIFLKLKGTYTREMVEINPCVNDNKEACITKVIVHCMTYTKQ